MNADDKLKNVDTITTQAMAIGEKVLRKHLHNGILSENWKISLYDDGHIAAHPYVGHAVPVSSDNSEDVLLILHEGDWDSNGDKDIDDIVELWCMDAKDQLTSSIKQWEDEKENDDLAVALDKYTDKTSDEYDPKFDAEIRRLRPIFDSSSLRKRVECRKTPRFSHF